MAVRKMLLVSENFHEADRLQVPMRAAGKFFRINIDGSFVAVCL